MSIDVAGLMTARAALMTPHTYLKYCNHKKTITADDKYAFFHK